MGRARAWIACTIVALLLIGCSEASRQQLSTTASRDSASLGRLEVDVPQGWDGTVTVGVAAPTEALLADTQALLGAGFVAGMPLEITTDRPVPAEGLTITRTYPARLNEGMAATLAFFDSAAGGWQAVPSQLSADRRTVSATVTHLSAWNDFILGSKQSLNDFGASARGAVRSAADFTASAASAAGRQLAEAADWMFYAVGKTFDTRVDAPICEDSNPRWVTDVTVISDHRNNPIRFCTGLDARDSRLLVVKARVNRGYAFAAVPAVDTVWRYNSGDPTGLWDAVLPWLRANDEALRDALFQVNGGDPRLSVGAGQEFSLGLAEEVVRDAPNSTVLTLEPPSAITFLYSVLGQLIMQDLGLKDTSLLTTALALSICVTSIAEADRTDPLAIASTVLTCLQTQSESITKLTVRIMTETGRDASSTVATSRVLTRASIYLALIGPVFSTMNWVAETQTLKNARTVDVFTPVQPVKCGSKDWGLNLNGATGPPADKARVIYQAALACDKSTLLQHIRSDNTEFSLSALSAEELFAIPSPEDRYNVITALMSTTPGRQEDGTLYWPNWPIEERWPDLEELASVGLWDLSTPIDQSDPDEFYRGWQMGFGPSGDFRWFYVGD